MVRDDHSGEGMDTGRWADHDRLEQSENEQNEI